MGQPTQTPLSYSLPAFEESHYDDIETKLKSLSDLGFRWVTFTPTYKVTTFKRNRKVIIPGTPVPPQPAWLVALKILFRRIKAPTIKIFEDTVYDLDLSPMPMAKLKTAVNKAVSMGFHVKIEPHLDYGITFASTYEQNWRMFMRFHPDDGDSMNPHYYTAILLQIFWIIRDAAKLPRPPESGPACFALTLGSELDASLFEFSWAWNDVLSRLIALRKAANLDNPFRLSFGHKLNFDTLTNLQTHLDRVNMALRRDRMPQWNMATITGARANAIPYLQRLDYCSFSFYAPIEPKLPSGTFDWTSAATDADEAAIAVEFAKVAQGLRAQLGTGVPLDIGEFGLGNLHGEGPYEDIPGDFVFETMSGALEKHEGAFAARRKYVRALGKFLSQQKSEFAAKPPRCSNYLPLTFWTVKQYDFLGLWDYDISRLDGPTFPHELVVDDELKEWVSGYNKKVYGEQ
ncbi:MAG: hypothetical protein V7744_11780 [Pseudomonadales bacterium]